MAAATLVRARRTSALEERGQRTAQPPVTGVLAPRVVDDDGRRQQAQVLAEGLPSEAWVRWRSGEGTSGERVHEGAAGVLVEEAPPPGRGGGSCGTPTATRLTTAGRANQMRTV